MVTEAIPDDKLMQVLEAERKGLRDDYPIRPAWNSILAGVVYQHISIESLRRELLRNGEPREACGFDPTRGEKAVPSKDAYSSLLKTLMKKQHLIDEMFDGLIEELKNYLPDWGETSGDRQQGDKKLGEREKGSLWEQGVSWFGDKLHLLVDTTYELPVGYRVTKALARDRRDNGVNDYRGTVYCHCPSSNERYEMALYGFEKDRKTLKDKCPSAAYGVEMQRVRSVFGGDKGEDREDTACNRQADLCADSEEQL